MSGAGEAVAGRGNVFADLGLEEGEALMIRAPLGHAVRKRLEEQGCPPREVPERLGIEPAEAAKLMNGKYHQFSEDRLQGFLDRLERKGGPPKVSRGVSKNQITDCKI